MALTPLTLKRNSKKDMTGLPKYRLAVLGDCATQHLATSLRGYAYEEGICLELLDTDYNQILAQLLDAESETYKFNPQAVLIVRCVQKMYEKYTEAEDRTHFAESMMNELKEYESMLHEKSSANLLIFNIPEDDDRVYAGHGNARSSSFINQIRKYNLLLAEFAESKGNVFIIDASYIQNEMGRHLFTDDKLYYSAKMPFSMEALVKLAAECINIIKALMGKLKKCVVLDLDNTLWGGVVGDDGLEGIQIGELGVGHAYQAFQTWLKELKKTGIILCVCSKNDEDKAKEPFVKHPEMVLSLDDIAMFVANWEDKASNIRNIAETLNLGLDSFVFIDDNPFERDQVKTMIPEITVPEMPEDPADYVSYIKTLGLFERVSSSDADADRTKKYQEEAGRATLSKAYKNYDEYLAALEMEAEAIAFTEYNYPRIAQLSQRSNQFNLRTVRYTEAEVRERAESGDYITLTFSLKDKFGDHGLISVVAIKKQGKKAFIENWFMSCRVLKRTMEQFIINTVIDECKKAGLDTVEAEYIRTPKNNMVSEIYGNMGFTKIDDNLYELTVDNYKEQTTFIKRLL